jgi:hypothetical protein
MVAQVDCFCELPANHPWIELERARGAHVVLREARPLPGAAVLVSKSELLDSAPAHVRQALGTVGRKWIGFQYSPKFEDFERTPAGGRRLRGALFGELQLRAEQLAYRVVRADPTCAPDDTLEVLLADDDAGVRERAFLELGRRSAS